MLSFVLCCTIVQGLIPLHKLSNKSTFKDYKYSSDYFREALMLYI